MTSEFVIAVHALELLAHKTISLSSEELSANICTNPTKIRKVMSKLKKSNLIQTKEGTKGGYLFVGNPKEISLAQISAALECHFITMNWKSGNLKKDCAIASGMTNAMETVTDALQSSCMEKLSTVMLSDIDNFIF